MTKSYHPSREKRGKNLILDLLGYYDIKEVITDIARGEADLDTLKAGASLIPAGKVIKLPKVIKAIGNVGKTGFKKGKEGEKTVWKRFTQEDKPKPDKNKGNQSKAGSKSGITTSKPNQEEASKSGQAKQTKAKNKGDGGSKLKTVNKSTNEVDKVLTRNGAFRDAKRRAGIPNSTQPKKPVDVYDGTTENRRVYEFEVDGKKKYIIEHREDKFGRGSHFHGADDLKGSPLDRKRKIQSISWTFTRRFCWL